VGDFNGDGKLDLAITNTTGAVAFDIFYGQGDGTFQSAIGYVASSFPGGIAAGNFTGTGVNGVAVPYGVGELQVDVIGSPNIQSHSYALAGKGAGISVGDFNGDGKADIAVLCGGNAAVLLGKGDGTFAAPILTAGVSGSNRLVTGDFNGDGNLDLAISNATTNNLTILLGTGTGTFTPAASPATGKYPQGIVAADLTGSGVLDLAVANTDDNSVTILLSNRDGTFTAAPTIAIGTN